MKKKYDFLLKLGFGENEARAYYTLLEKSPANGYDVAARSGIPRSKVYQSLDKLVERGAAVRIENDKKKGQLFAPTDPYNLVKTIEEEMKHHCDEARTAIDEFDLLPSVTETFRRILSTKEMVVRAERLIDEAQDSLHAALWPDEFHQVLPNLLNATDRKVKMALLLYAPDSGLQELQSRGVGAVLHQTQSSPAPVLGRQFVLVSDCQKCITGTVLPDHSVDGAYTHNQGIVINALDLVNHEIYLERIMATAGKQIKEKYGERLEKLDAFDPAED